MDPHKSPSDGLPGPGVSDRLDSWKAVAGYVKRDVRTVQRWEATEGLPIHRRQLSRRGPIYAYKSEIEVWWKAHQPASKQRQSEPEPAETRRRSAFKRLYPELTIYAVLVVALALSIAKAKQMFLNRRHTVPAHLVTIAVLPFRSASNSPDDTNAALNLTDEVITDCKRSPSLRVVDKNLVIPYQNTAENPQHVAQLLHSQKVLTGTASRSGNTIRVMAQLIDPKSGDAIWSRQFEGNTEDLLESEQQIANSIASDIENVVAAESNSSNSLP